MSESMKVHIAITVEVDLGIWGLEYGFDPEDKTAIREDVQAYYRQQILEGNPPVEAGAVRAAE